MLVYYLQSNSVIDLVAVALLSLFPSKFPLFLPSFQQTPAEVALAANNAELQYATH